MSQRRTPGRALPAKILPAEVRSTEFRSTEFRSSDAGPLTTMRRRSSLTQIMPTKIIPVKVVLAMTVLALAYLALSRTGAGTWLPVAPSGRRSTPQSYGAATRAVLAAAVTVCVALLLRWRARQDSAESTTWRQFYQAGCVLAAAATIQAGVALADLFGFTGLGNAANLPLEIAALVVCPFTYQGLVHWNRYRTLTADPGDWLNGISAGLALVALGNLIVQWSDVQLVDWQTWQVQSWLVRISAVVVVVGTAPTVAALGGLLRDVRVWMVSFGFAVVVGAEAASELPAFTGFGSWLQDAWVLALVAIGCAAVMAPAGLQPRGSTSQAPTIGALVVLLASVSLLVLDDLPGNHSSITALFAVLAVVGVSTRAVHLVRDLDQLANSRLQALTDELTGIPNRRALIKRLESDDVTGSGVTLLVLDLDRFKDVNDRLGHSAGDDLLRRVATRLQDELTPSALLARLGGDEFAILLDGSDLGSARAIGNALVAAASAVVPTGGGQLRVGASVGVATAAIGERSTGEELLRRADVAMYAAKSTGGGVSLYDKALDAESAKRARLGDELLAVLDPAAGPAVQQQIVVYYQPQIDLRTGTAVGAEALVRWQHPRLGLLAPDAFLDLAEEHGTMAALTALVMQQAAQQAVRWRADGQPLRISVNLSTSCLTNPLLLPLVDDVLADSGLDPAQLVLEVTETDVMADPERAIKTLNELAERGVGLSIDDYGTGYSSLAYLNTLPAHELKLDRTFLTGLLTDQRTAAIIAATIDLAHRLGLRLIAEGVEDLPTLRALTALGCDETQGYYHSRPLPAEAFETWRAAHRPQAALRAM